VIRPITLACLGASLAVTPAWATVPTGAPTFTHPLSITNAYQPFVPGALKVFAGTKDGRPSVIADLYLTATRTFRVNGVDVPCHILQETEFSAGQLVEISLNHFAQADDGTIYYFGELVDSYARGLVTDHEGSWLVGGPSQPGDPPETANAPSPTVFMPANPAVGDVFKQEDLFPTVDETDTVRRTGLTIKAPAGSFGQSIQVLETTRLGDPPEVKWYAAGVGTVKGRTKGERFALIANTFVPP
jgi:hypothetical protein